MSDSEDEDGDNRRNQSNFKHSSNKRKASPEPVNGSTASTVETAATVAASADEKTENGSVNELEKAPVENSEESAAKLSSTPAENPPEASTIDESSGAAKETITTTTTDGMDTSE